MIAGFVDVGNSTDALRGDIDAVSLATGALRMDMIAGFVDVGKFQRSIGENITIRSGDISSLYSLFLWRFCFLKEASHGRLSSVES